MKYLVRGFIALLLIILAGSAVTIPAWGLYNNLRSGTDTVDNPVGEAYQSRTFWLEPGALSPTPEDDGPAALKIELISIDPGSTTANLNVTITLPGIELLDNTGHLRGEYKNRSGQLIIGDITISVPLESLASQAGFARSIQVPMRANPGRYPNDWYRIPIGEVLFVGPGLSYREPYQTLPFIPTAVELIAWPSMEGKSIKVNIDNPISTVNFTEVRSEEIEHIEILVSRTAMVKNFVWAMALTPSLLLFVALFQLLNRVRQQTGARTETFIPLELAVAVLAILPLRQVLIPSDIQGLTVVDFALGTQLAAFIALVVFQRALASLQT
jgi:hypothetical protein